MSWQQDGFLVLSDAGVPLYHGFFTTRWEADSKLKEVQALPEAELKYGATVVPARLWFDWRGTPKASPTLETGPTLSQRMRDVGFKSRRLPAIPDEPEEETALEHDPGQEREWHWRQACTCQRCSDETKRAIAAQNRGV